MKTRFAARLAAVAMGCLMPLTLLAGDKTSMQLFFTGDLYGYIKPCG